MNNETAIAPILMDKLTHDKRRELSSEQLISVVLGLSEPDSGEVFKLLRYNLDDMPNLSTKKLIESGLPETTARRLNAAITLGVRTNTLQQNLNNLSVKDYTLLPLSIAELFEGVREDELRYEVVLLTFNDFYKSTKSVPYSHKTAPYPTIKDTLTPVLMKKAKAFYICTNHLNEITPKITREDVFFAARLADAAHVLGIDLKDHVVYGKSGESASVKEKLPHIFEKDFRLPIKQLEQNEKKLAKSNRRDER